MAKVVVEDVEIVYGKTFVAVEDFSLEVGDGEFGVLLGPSGCGKSTLLNAVAGLTTPTRGRITIGNTVVFDSESSVNMPPNLRDVGMVYQSYALWPHMTVFENVAFPLKRKRAGRGEIKARVAEVLEQVRCSALADRYPNQLSGGQQQRVSLARALAGRPKLMLMDEPLSNLDAELRRELREEIARLHGAMGFSALYVTHDQQEALGLGSTIAVMRAGHIVQVSTPDALYAHPHTLDVATFLGANAFEGRLCSPAEFPRPTAATGFGFFELRDQPAGAGPLHLAVFPTGIELEPTNDEHAAVVVVAKFLGDRYEYVVEDELGNLLRVVDRPQGRGLHFGQRVVANADPRHVHVYDEAGDAIGSPEAAVLLAEISAPR